MTRTETAQIMAILRAAYPTFYAKVTRQDADATVNLWAEMFADDRAEDVAWAVKGLIASRTSNFPPNIGEVKEALYRQTQPQEMLPSEAWAIVSRAASSCSLMEPEKTFDKLPEDIRKAIGSARVLKEWALADSHEFATVIASNFQRAYRTVQQRRADDAKIPAAFRLPSGGGLQRLAYGARELISD